MTNETRNDIKKLGNYIDSMANQQDQQQHPVLLGETNAAEVNQYYFYERIGSFIFVFEVPVKIKVKLLFRGN